MAHCLGLAFYAFTAPTDMTLRCMHLMKEEFKPLQQLLLKYPIYDWFEQLYILNNEQGLLDLDGTLVSTLFHLVRTKNMYSLLDNSHTAKETTVR